MTFKDFIPASARRAVYATTALVGVLLGAVQVAYGAAEAGQPTWLTVALAVFAFLSGAVGFTARAHTGKPGGLTDDDFAAALADTVSRHPAGRFLTSDPAERGKPGAVWIGDDGQAHGKHADN